MVEQGNAKLHVNNLDLSDDQMVFEIDSIHASFKGKRDGSGKTYSGTFTQHGKSFGLEFEQVTSFDQNSGQLIEYWKGALDYNGRAMKMGLKVFRNSDGSLNAKLSSYSQGATDLPVEFEKEGDNYTVKFPAARLEYIGQLNESKKKLVGTIKQAGIENELNFTKAEISEAPKFNRPQTPKKPFPYESIDVRYENSKYSITLAGTLTLPRGNGPYPVAIIISGSGPTKRDGTLYKHRPYQVIADHLTRKGIAVLRFDDRGTGDSTGKHSTATSADLATDVEAGIEFLKNHPKIDVDKIGLIGHSEGGLIAPMIAAKRDDVHYIVLLAGTGVNGGVILKSQSTAMMAAAGVSEEKLKANQNVHDAILSVLQKNPRANHDILKNNGPKISG